MACFSFDPDEQMPHGGSTVGAELGGGVGAFVGSGDFVGAIEDDGCKEGCVDSDGASDVVGEAVGTDSSRGIGSFIRSTAHLQCQEQRRRKERDI